MESKYVADEQFRQLNFTDKPFEKGEYEGCTFTHCNFHGVDLVDIKFMECEFIECDFSNANIDNTAFQDISFRNCKLLGLQFERCNSFGFSVSFDQCVINHSTFYQMKLAKTAFTHCQLEGVDFTETDLKQAKITDCNLLNASFEHTNLEQADLRNSINYSINPEVNRMKGAKFSLSGVAGLLDKYGISIDKGS
ncbi:MAG: pentapeptide repeat-containing protein [Cyclobacteriaceae bacterium]